ncbi:MAG: metal ABC transporter permease [Rhodobacter sp.]|nr:metal ABC transporter permease [Rhodobacter sp.]
MDDFLIRAALAGIGVALAAGPLGSFVIWRRMAYFGDAMAHGAILGVALALALSTSVLAGTLAVALVMALAVSALVERGHAMDATLGVLAHAALAIGLMAFSLIRGARVDLNAFLFGDILAVTATDLVVIWGGALMIVALLVWRWQALLTATLNEELARSAGIDPRRERLVLTIALALVVAVSLKVVGALLIGAMLIIPAAAARGFARSPEAMAALAVLAGALAAVAGLALSFYADTPAGPSIVSVAAALYLFSVLAGRASR